MELLELFKSLGLQAVLFSKASHQILLHAHQRFSNLNRAIILYHDIKLAFHEFIQEFTDIAFVNISLVHDLFHQLIYQVHSFLNITIALWFQAAELL